MEQTTLCKENFIFNRTPFAPSSDTIQFFTWFDSLWKPGFATHGQCMEYVAYTFIMEGSYSVFRPDGISTIGEGDFLISSKSYTKAGVAGPKPCHRKSFMLYKNTLHDTIVSQMFKKENIIFHPVNKENINVIMDLIRDEMSDKQDGPILAGLYFRLLHELYSQHYEKILPERLNKALVFINANLHNSRLSREIIAETAGVSIRTLCRLFEQHLNIQPTAYIINLRMEHIRNLLAMPNLNIKEIAEKTGFASAGFMARIFKQKYNMPPSQYRNLLWEKTE